MSFDILEVIRNNQGDNYELHKKNLNPQLPKVLHTLGFDKCYDNTDGAYIKEGGDRYLDLLCGYGVFNFGRRHPVLIDTMKKMLEVEIPNMVHFECPLLGGVLAEELLSLFPEELNRVFFANSGAESVEGAIKFARRFTGRDKLLRCSHAFHGLTTGALSLNGNRQFRQGFGSLLPTEEIPFNDVQALKEKLSTGDFAGFFMEPIQGKGVNISTEEFFQAARQICSETETVFVVDEVQTGFGRTGEMFAFEHYGVTPDIVCVAKALSGGYIPVGALVVQEDIFCALFDSMDNCMLHSSTYSQNNLAMAAGLATLHVLKEENLAQEAREKGEYFLGEMKKFEEKYEMVKEVRGRGMMLGIEFGPPKSYKLKIGWKLLHQTDGLFGQLLVIPLMRDHGILTQVAGHNDIIKLLPPLNIPREDIDYVIEAFDEVLASCHKFPGSIWDMGKTLASLGKKAIKSKLEK